MNNLIQNFSHAFGFTLVETLVVVSLIAVFINLSLVSGIDAYDRGVSRTDRELLLAAIREARAQSMNEFCTNTPSECSGMPPSHGVQVTASQITIFEGSTFGGRFAPADSTLPFSTSENLGGSSSSEVTFAPGTGDVPSPVIFSITGNDHRTENILINTQGAIFASTTPIPTP